ncbi:hypothetical protein ES703_69579 [subsurface metagenome]
MVRIEWTERSLEDLKKRRCYLFNLQLLVLFLLIAIYTLPKTKPTVIKIETNEAYPKMPSALISRKKYK